MKTENGGIKIQVGLDSNANGSLDEDEINESQTTYLCNGIDGTNGSGNGGSSGSFVSDHINIMVHCGQQKS